MKTYECTFIGGVIGTILAIPFHLIVLKTNLYNAMVISFFAGLFWYLFYILFSSMEETEK